MPKHIRTTTDPKTDRQPRAPKAAQPSSSKKGIDRQQVLIAARDLCNTHGFEVLSIKDLADRLGIRPPSVYAHFDGLPTIRRELAKWGHRALAERLGRSAIGLAGPDALVAVATAYLRFIREEPGLYAATVAPPMMADAQSRDAAAEWLSVFHRLLESMGLHQDDHIHALRGIRSMVHGFGQLEANGSFRGRPDRDLSFERMLRTFVSAIAVQAHATKSA